MENFKNASPAWSKKFWIFKGSLTEERDFVRFFNGVTSDHIGSWMVPEEVVRGLTPLQIKQVLALPEIPTRYSKVILPKNSKVLVGRVAPNSFGGVDGAIQILAENPQEEYFKEVKILGEFFGGLQ